MSRRYKKQIGRHDAAGVIVTLERRTDATVTASTHAAHASQSEALRRALAPFDSREWRVRTISTPTTIYDDLTHARRLIDPSDLARGSRRGQHYQAARSIGGVK